MVSKTAQADIEDMWDAGLKPTFHDIIRLNALALEVEGAKGRFAMSELPRVAFLGDVAFREPTIGSEIWFASASRLFNLDDIQTYLILRAYSLSMQHDQLPDPTDERTILKSLQDFRLSVGFYTMRQIMCAVGYAIHGFDADSMEQPAKRKTKTDEVDIQHNDLCYEIGLLHQGMTYKIGNAADLKDLKPRALQEMITTTMMTQLKIDVRKSFVSTAEDDYLRTLDEITARLKGQSNG